MDLTVEAAEDLRGTDGIRKGKGGFPRGAFPKAQDAIDLIFPIFVVTLDLDGQNGAVRFMLTNDFDGFFH